MPYYEIEIKFKICIDSRKKLRIEAQNLIAKTELTISLQFCDKEMFFFLFLIKEADHI